MSDTRLTVVGRLVNAVEATRLADGTTRAKFRVACTERRRDRAGGWGDGDSLYLDVVCWRKLAVNADASLVKGDPVVVTGRFYTREYEHEGQRRSAMTLEAYSIGPDLSWCTAAITRTRHRAAADDAADDAAPTQASGGTVEVPRLVAAVPGGEG